jgi:hypothetical protein
MGNLCAGGPSEAPSRQNVPLMTEYDEESESNIRGGAHKMRGGAQAVTPTSTATSIIDPLFTPTGAIIGGILIVLLAIAIAGMAATGFGISVGYFDNIKNGVPCNKNKVDTYSLSERYPDSNKSDWLTQSRDFYSSSHNPHLPNLGSNVQRATGFCPAGVSSFSTGSNNIGVTVTPTVSQDLGMMFFADHGVVGTHLGTTIYGVNLSTCVLKWSVTLQDLTAQTSPVPGGNDPDGIDNPMADVFSSLQLVSNRFKGNPVIVFADMGTGMYYNQSMCDTLQTCGARLFVLDTMTGALFVRTLIKETSPIVVNYTRWSDEVTMSPQVYREIAYVGTTSNETYTVVDTGLLDFYGVYAGINIYDGTIMFIDTVNNAFQTNDGNIGSGFAGTPPIDIESNLILFGVTNALNYSESVAACLAAGNSRYVCQDGLNNNQLFAIDAADAITQGTATITQWRWSPFGADAWNAACLTDSVNPCPSFAGPYFGYFAGSMIIQNQCGQRFVISIGQSGSLYSNTVNDGSRQWITYLGPTSNATATYGMSFDGTNIWVTIGNLDKKSYLTLDGVKRCDSFWAKVNAWTGVLEDIIPVPCSRASVDCPAIVPDPWLTGFFPTNVLDFSNRGHARNGSAVRCPTTSPTDDRQGAFGATAVGSIITTNKLMFAGSFSGHMHVYGLDGNYIASLEQCATGIIFGGASIAKLNDGKTLLSYGCGYGNGPYEGRFGDNRIIMLQVA